jgi:hypothetical protein
MSNQPEAERLADWLGQGNYSHEDVTRAAAELRRLHAEVNELKRTLALQQQSYEREIQIEVEAEREACAKECDAVAQKMDDEGEGPTGYIAWVTDCAASIRARGKA